MASPVSLFTPVKDGQSPISLSARRIVGPGELTVSPSKEPGPRVLVHPVSLRVGSLPPCWRWKDFVTNSHTLPCIEADGVGETPEMCHSWEEVAPSPGL